ncbi:hypothetical protein MTR67_033653 [Solanum verrucosum]|uniref:Uncharacterized protein n=1 Tax=Solanum verrucosum TaxID=315347 RepID=A0AAF0U6F3_SOLVR|nr:hypothetical protein MTR67_033653 [Solanum verrucosum]
MGETRLNQTLTEAAPTYFAPHYFVTTTSNGDQYEFNLVDGGVATVGDPENALTGSTTTWDNTTLANMQLLKQVGEILLNKQVSKDNPDETYADALIGFATKLSDRKKLRANKASY